MRLIHQDVARARGGRRVAATPYMTPAAAQTATATNAQIELLQQQMRGMQEQLDALKRQLQETRRRRARRSSRRNRRNRRSRSRGACPGRGRSTRRAGAEGDLLPHWPAGHRQRRRPQQR